MTYTVVTTVYNDEQEISCLLEEMIHQERLPEEIIIVDGGSKDSTVEVIREFQKSSKVSIRLVAEKGKRYNIAEGFNAAIRLAKTELVGIVAVGNHYPENFFKVLVQGIEQNQELDAAFSVIKGKCHTRFAETYSRVFYGLGKKSYAPSNHGVLMRKSTIEELEYFYERFFYAGEDLLFFADFLQRAKKVQCFDETCVYWEVPQTWEEYFKQNYVYCIGALQSYSNYAVFQLYASRLSYVGLWIFGVLCVLFLSNKWVGLGIMSLCLISNTKLIWKKGLRGCLLRNAEFFLTVFNLIRGCKYFLNHNKVEPERRLYKVYKHAR